MLLFVIRHGDPIYDPDNLTPLGHRQAEALAKRFAIHGLDRIFSSPLNRAKETARPTSEVLKLPIEIEEWTSENLAWCDFSVTFPDRGTHWVFDQHNGIFHQNGDELLGNGNWKQAQCVQLLDVDKCYKRISAASDEFLERLGYRRTGTGLYQIVTPGEQRVALFCHAGFSMAWFPYLLGIPPHLFWSSFDVNHAGVTVFEFKNQENGITAPRCLSFSDNSHLLASGLPYKFQNRIDI